jgi:hypothetical protein
MDAGAPSLRAIDVQATVTQVNLRPSKLTELVRREGPGETLTESQQHPWHSSVRVCVASINRSTSVSVRYSL